MKQRFISAFEDILAANKDGEVKNLLITDGNSEFLDDGLYALRRWVLDNRFNLVELDERECGWFDEIQSRELFAKLNQPNTVLLVKNYATLNWFRGDNTPRNFLRDAVLNRHYGCGNDFVPSDDLPTLLFVVALNDLSEMYWEKEEFSYFAIMHEDESKAVWSNECIRYNVTEMHSVMSRENKELYRVSEDEKDLFFEVEKAFRGLVGRPWRKDELMRMREEYVYQYFKENHPDFYEQVENLILQGYFSREYDEYKLDAARLLAVFPNLKTVCCHHDIVIENATSALRVLDPFEMGEYSFEMTKRGDFDEASRYFRILWALDSKWAKFWGEVARDFNRKPEDHPKFDLQGVMTHDGMDDLFRIYLLGWYSPFPIEEEEKIYVKKHKNFQKAIELLPIRFQNCDLHEVSEKLYWDLQYVESDSNPDFDNFFRVLVEAELLFPGAAEGIYKDGWIDYDNYDQLCEHLWSMGDEMTAETIRKMIDSGADALSVEEYLKKMSAVSCDAAGVLYELYKNGHTDTIIAYQYFVLDFSELKNDEKAADHAEKYNIKHNI